MSITDKKIIYLDWDDCIYDLMSVNVKYIQDNYKKDFSPLECESFEYLSIQYPKIYDDVWNNFELYKTGKLRKNALEKYNKLVNTFGLDRVKIITNTAIDIIDEKEEMMKELGFNCQIIHTSKKYKWTRDHILVDDSYHNIEKHVLYIDHTDMYFLDSSFGYLVLNEDFGYSTSEKIDKIFKCENLAKGSPLAKDCCVSVKEKMVKNIKIMTFDDAIEDIIKTYR